MLIRLSIMMIAFFSAAAAMANDSPAPGIYVTDGGWGQLSVVRQPDKTLSFSLFSVGANAHICDFDGVIVDGKSTIGDGVECEISFTSHPDRIEVGSSDSEVCRGFCGVRASFEGDYRVVAPECRPAAVAKSRADFLALYQKKSYAQARAVLEPILSNCRNTLSELEDSAPIRNDLAITYYKLGNFAACTDILSPYAEDAAMEDDDIENYNYAMYENEAYMKIIHSARFNLALCRKGAGKK